MTLILDGRQMTSREAAHSHIQTQLRLPGYYGRNLDALYDLLTEMGQPMTISVTHLPELKTGLGIYAGALLRTLEDSAKANPVLTLDFLPE